MLPRLARSMESFADKQHVHFRVIALHRPVTGGQYDSSTVECMPGSLGPRALSMMRQRRSLVFSSKLNLLLD